MTSCVHCGGQCLDPHDEEGEPCPRCLALDCVCPRCPCGVLLTKEEEPDDQCGRCMSNKQELF